MVALTGTAAQRERAAAAGDALRDEFAFLRRPLLLFIGVLLGAALLVGASDWMRGDRAQTLAATRALHDTALARLHSARFHAGHAETPAEGLDVVFSHTPA